MNKPETITYRMCQALGDGKICFREGGFHGKCGTQVLDIEIGPDKMYIPSSRIRGGQTVSNPKDLTREQQKIPACFVATGRYMEHISNETGDIQELNVTIPDENTVIFSTKPNGYNTTISRGTIIRKK